MKGSGWHREEKGLGRLHVYTDTPHCPHKTFQQYNSHIKPSSPSRQDKYMLSPLTAELNRSAQRCMTKFFTADFASLILHLFNIYVKHQQMQQLFIQFIN
jgi:hypothetical protein